MWSIISCAYLPSINICFFSVEVSFYVFYPVFVITEIRLGVLAHRDEEIVLLLGAEVLERIERTELAVSEGEITVQGGGIIEFTVAKGGVLRNLTVDFSENPVQILSI